MNIVYFSTGPNFRHFHRRPFISRLAEQLKRNNGSVLYFNRPTFILNFFKRDQAESERVIQGNIYARPLYMLLPLSLCFKFPILLHLGAYLPVKIQTVFWLRWLNFKGEFKTWICKPDQFLYTKGLHKNLIYEHYDNYDDDYSYPFSSHPEYHRVLKQCVTQSLASFCTSHSLINRHANLGSWHYLPNAVDDNLIAKPRAQNSDNRPMTIGFVGTIDESIDDVLIEKICRAFPNIEVRLIGPVRSHIFTRLSEDIANLHLVGQVPYSQLADYISNFTVAICPYKTTEFNQYRNPLKLYEYCALGVPSVSTGCDFDPDGKALIEITTDHDSFVSSVDKLLQPAQYDFSQALIQFAVKNTWSVRAKQAITAIDRKCLERYAYE